MCVVNIEVESTAYANSMNVGIVSIACAVCHEHRGRSCSSVHSMAIGTEAQNLCHDLRGRA